METAAEAVAPEERRLAAAGDGATIVWRIRRASRPRGLVILLHGLASNMSRWAEFAAATRLARHWSVARADLRGHGESLHRGRIGFEAWCGDLEALLAAEGASRAVLVGHCLGANLALHFAARHPGKVEGLVLVEPMFRAALAGALDRVARFRPLFVPFVLLLRALAALGLHRRRLATLDLERLDRETRAAMAAAGGRFPEERYASWVEDLKSLPVSVYFQDLLAVTAPMPELASIAAPALAILSRGTSLSDPAETGRRLAALPQVEIRHLDAQHWIPTEQPEALRAAIEDWVDRKMGTVPI